MGFLRKGRVAMELPVLTAGSTQGINTNVQLQDCVLAASEHPQLAAESAREELAVTHSNWGSL